MFEIQPCPRTKLSRAILVAAVIGVFTASLALAPQPLTAQAKPPAWTKQQKPIVKQLEKLRQLPDSTRGRVTQQLALQIRQLPPSINKLRLATALAERSTEGDPGGHETIQAVATTLAATLQQVPIPVMQNRVAMPYMELATLVIFEHVQVSLDSPEFTAAMNTLKQQNDKRQKANFTLTDLQGKNWTLNDLRGKVVLVNFWATWCPPCRAEMPDLESLYQHYKGQGLVILGISDEKAPTVRPFINEEHVTYPVLLDPGRKVNTLFSVEGIPMSFVYNRQGKLVAEAADMRTPSQFQQMLSEAGLK